MESTVGCFLESCFLQFSVEQVLVWLRKQLINNFVFPTWAFTAGFNNNNSNKNNKLYWQRTFGNIGTTASFHLNCCSCQTSKEYRKWCLLGEFFIGNLNFFILFDFKLRTGLLRLLLHLKTAHMRLVQSENTY